MTLTKNCIKFILYGAEVSPPTRAVKLTLAALDLKYDYKLLNLLAGDHMTKEYRQKNLQHTIPLLKTGDNYIWDSHAIMTYLVTQFGKTDALYPKEPLLRAKVNQRLHFESGVLFQGCLRNIALPVIYRNIPNVPREKIDAIYEAYDFLELFAVNKYMCGNDITIADFSIIATVTSLVGLAPIDPNKYPNLTAWIARMKTWPNYEKINGYGAQLLVDMFENKTKIKEGSQK